MIVVDVEGVVVETVVAVGPSRASQVMPIVVAVAVAAVAVVVVAATHLLSTQLQLPEEFAISTGPLAPASAALTARSGTRQGFRRLRPPHGPRIIPRTFSR